LSGAGLKPGNKTVISVAAAAGLICLLLYLPALFCDFVNWDDPLYIIENPAIRLLDWKFVAEALTTSYMGWWMPLTWISLAVDYHFWGLNPFGYHLTNVLLHAVNTGLVVLVADRLLQGSEAQVSGPGKYYYLTILLLAGMFWGLHPLRVESVAWVTERKDVLNGIFSLTAILFYLRYAQMRDEGGYTGKALRSYIFSLLFLMLSLMSKPVSVVIPAMLLVADWYPLNRIQKGRVLQILLEKVPFLILVLLITFATIQLASGNQILVSYDDLSFFKRCLLAGNALFEYCRLSLYPIGIIHFYLLLWPFPASYAVKTLAILIFSCFCFWNFKKNPWVPAVWLSFVLPLVPVLGFFQNGAQSHAARFTYLPAVMPAICAAVLVGEAYRKGLKTNTRHARILLIGVIVAVLLFNVFMTERLVGSWRNTETLWTRAITIQPVGRAYYLRADYYLQTGKYDDAAADLQISIEMGKKAGFPQLFNLHALRGDALNKAGRYQEAFREFSEAIILYPYSNYYYHRGQALNALGNKQDAEADLLRAGDATGPITWQDAK
jgi:tetratricopeptide (TPR) repeat protein